MNSIKKIEKQSSIFDIDILYSLAFCSGNYPAFCIIFLKLYSCKKQKQLQLLFSKQTALLQQPNISFDCIISGLANSYSDYITTYEEYQVHF